MPGYRLSTKHTIYYDIYPALHGSLTYLGAYPLSSGNVAVRSIRYPSIRFVRFHILVAAVVTILYPSPISFVNFKILHPAASTTPGRPGIPEYDGCVTIWRGGSSGYRFGVALSCCVLGCFLGGRKRRERRNRWEGTLERLVGGLNLDWMGLGICLQCLWPCSGR